ncbi:Putative prolyl 4-hydroxylase, partial [Frankliniella fusca]
SDYSKSHSTCRKNGKTCTSVVPTGGDRIWTDHF